MLFTVGIGSSVSHALVEGLAEAGGGACEFVVGEERLEPKVVRQLARALHPPPRLVSADWRGVDAMLPPPCVHRSSTGRVVVSASISACVEEGWEDGLHMVLHLQDEQQHAFSLNLPVLRVPAGETLTPTIGRLMIEDCISDLNYVTGEQRHEIEAKIVQLSISRQLLTSRTALVAVDHTVGTELPLQRIVFQRKISANHPPHRSPASYGSGVDQLTEEQNAAWAEPHRARAD